MDKQTKILPNSTKESLQDLFTLDLEDPVVAAKNDYAMYLHLPNGNAPMFSIRPIYPCHVNGRNDASTCIIITRPFTGLCIDSDEDGSTYLLFRYRWHAQLVQLWYGVVETLTQGLESLENFLTIPAPESKIQNRYYD